MKRKNVLIIASSVIVLLLVIVLVLLISMEKTKDKEQERIGIILPLSGQFAEIGKDVLDGVNLYKEQNPDVTIIMEDDGFESKKSINAYRKLRDFDKISIIVGPLGPVTINSVAGAMNNKDKEESLVIGLTLCTDEFDKYVNIFCTYPSLKFQVKEAAKTIKRYGTTAYIITENTETGNLLLGYAESYFDQYNIQLAGKDKFLPDETLFYTIATKAIDRNPDAIYIVSATPISNLKLASSLREQNYNGKIIIGSDITEKYLVEFGDVLDGVLFVGLIDDNYLPKFTESFIAKYGKNPNMYNAYGYELVAAAFKAQERNIAAESFPSLEEEYDFAIEYLQYEGRQARIPMVVKEVVNTKLVISKGIQ